MGVVDVYYAHEDETLLGQSKLVATTRRLVKNQESTKSHRCQRLVHRRANKR